MKTPPHYAALDGYQTSAEILAAIEQIAADEFEAGDEDTECHRIWAEPTPDEIKEVERIAWELADDDETSLCWGDTTVERPK